MKMAVDVAVNATVILFIGLVLLRAMRSLDAAAKHRFCVATLALIVLLPASCRLLALDHSTVLASITVEDATSLQGKEMPLHWIWVLWASGASFVLLRFFAGIAYLAFLTRRASEAEQGLAPQGVSVYYADVNTPLSWGWFRPTILAPRAFLQWSPEVQTAVIKHELAHVARRDAWAGLLITAARAMYWFHPLVWRLSRAAVEQREFAADDHVVSSGTDAVSYVRSLLVVARGRGRSELLACGMTSGALRARVDRLLVPKIVYGRARSRLFSACSVGVLLGCALVLPVRAHVAEEIDNIGGSVSAPQIVKKIEPAYTEASKRAKRQGTVLLSVVIGKQGKPRDVHVERGLSPDLDEQAVRALSSWRFKPAMKHGKPVAVRAKVEVNFHLL